MSTPLSREQLIKRIEAAVAAAGSQAALADKIGVSDAYLSDVLNNRRDPGEKMLAGLGYAREVRYVQDPA